MKLHGVLLLQGSTGKPKCIAHPNKGMANALCLVNSNLGVSSSTSVAEIRVKHSETEFKNYVGLLAILIFIIFVKVFYAFYKLNNAFTIHTTLYNYKLFWKFNYIYKN